MTGEVRQQDKTGSMDSFPHERGVYSCTLPSVYLVCLPRVCSFGGRKFMMGIDWLGRDAV